MSYLDRQVQVKARFAKSFSEEEEMGLTVSVSATTREPRDGEKEGVNYFFLEKEKFKDMIGHGEFLEHAQVYDNFLWNT